MSSEKLDFRSFLTEALMNDDKDKLRTIINKMIAGDEQWLDNQVIDAKDKGGYWIVNYGIAGSNDYNRLVRGMVIQKPPVGWKGDPLTLIRSFPMTRFKNQHEIDAAPVDMANSEMLEKLDGTMVGVFFPTSNPTDPHWHTRKMLSAHKPDLDLKLTAFHGGEYQLLSLIGEYVKKLKFSPEDVRMTYVFEFIHAASFVWTKYGPDKYGLYMLAARNLDTYEELSEKELDDAANRLGVRRPRRWDAVANPTEIEALMKQISQDTPGFEGFVFRDKTSGNRIKVKDADYVKFHAMLDKRSYKNLVQKVLEGEADEILSYFPDTQPRIEEINRKFAKFLDDAVAAIEKYRKTDIDQKSLAMMLRSGKSIDPKTDYINSMVLTDANVQSRLTSALRKIAPEALLSLCGITDEEKDAAQTFLDGKERKSNHPPKVRSGLDKITAFIGSCARIAKASRISGSVPSDPEFLKNFVKEDLSIRKRIESSMRKLALGEGKQDGSPKRFLEIIGIQDDEEDENKHPDVGEI
jgi:hypothetical protein